MHTRNLISTTEAIKILGVDRSTLSRWVKFGDIKPVMRLGDGPRAAMVFDRDTVIDFRDTRAGAK